MYKVNDVIEIMDEYAPESWAMGFDTVGLQVGDKNGEITGVLVGLDLRDETIDEAIEKNCNLVVTHHPLFIGGINKIDFSTPIGRKIEKLIKNNISLYVSHTNFDICDVGTNDALFETLELADKDYLDEETNLGRIGILKKPMTLLEFINKVKTKLNLDSIRVVGDENMEVKKVGLCTGSSGQRDYMDLAKKCEVDVYISGDFTYHNMQYAEDIGLGLIDGTHFGTEYIGLENIKAILKSKFENTNIYISTTNKNVFKIY